MLWGFIRGQALEVRIVYLGVLLIIIFLLPLAGSLWQHLDSCGEKFSILIGDSVNSPLIRFCCHSYYNVCPIVTKFGSDF